MGLPDVELFLKVKHERVVERHVVSIAAENDEAVAKNESCVPISSHWPLASHLSRLEASVARRGDCTFMNSRKSVLEELASHTASHASSLTKLASLSH